jgi:hypothetical protein
VEQPSTDQKVSENFEQFFNGKARFMENCSESTDANGLVIRDNDTRMRCFPAKNDVAAPLPLHRETNSLESFDQVSTGKISR